MSIKGIHLENMTIKANNGVDLIEASDISLKNITLDIKNPKQLINIENSKAITLDHIKSISPTDLFVSVNGDRSTGISLTNTVTAGAKAPSEFKFGAESKALTIK